MISSMAGGSVVASGLEDELSRSNVVRLRGLPYSATEADIRDFFNGFDIGPDGILIQLNFQGRSTGQAYVQFATSEQANKALELNRQHMGSRYIEVFKGHPADMQGALRTAARAHSFHAGPSSGMPMFGETSVSGSGVPGMNGNSDMRYMGVVRMRGMPYSATIADITAFFKGLMIAPDGIFLCTHSDGRPTGEAYVEFATEEDAAHAMNFHREAMGSRYIELFQSTKAEMMAAVQQRMYGMLSSGAFSQFSGMNQLQGMLGGFNLPSLSTSNMNNLGMNMNLGMNVGMGMGMGMNLNNLGSLNNLNNLSNLNSLSLQQMQQQPPGHQHPMGSPGSASMLSESAAEPSSFLKLRGLPYSAGTNDILDFFDGYRVAPGGVHIMLGPTDRPTGEAYVEFVSSQEASRAMERHRKNIGSRYIELFRATRSEVLMAIGVNSLSNFNMGSSLNPSMQLLLLQQQQQQQQQLQAAAMGWSFGEFQSPFHRNLSSPNHPSMSSYHFSHHLKK